VAIHVDPADLSLAHNTERWRGALRLVGVQIGATGERYEGASQTVELDLLPETYQKALEQGLRLELRLKREPAVLRRATLFFAAYYVEGDIRFGGELAVIAELHLISHPH
jgi:hypothetical protein